MYRMVLTVCLFFSYVLTLTSPASAGETITTLDDLNGKRLGVIAGTTLDMAANTALDFTQILYYDDTDGVIEALHTGEIDAFLDDEPVARYLASLDPRLFVVPGKLVEDEYGYAMRHDDVDLYVKLDASLRKALANGTVASLETRWLDTPDADRPILPQPEADSAAPVLRFGVSAVSAPFVYEYRGAIDGLDIELMRLLAAQNNMCLEIVPMDFAELFAALYGGRVDVIGACMSITPDRQRLAHFTTPYYQAGVAAVTLK